MRPGAEKSWRLDGPPEETLRGSVRGACRRVEPENASASDGPDDVICCAASLFNSGAVRNGSRARAGLIVGKSPPGSQPSRDPRSGAVSWYLTGFLVPSNAPADQKSDEDDRGDFDLEASPGGDEEDATHETPAARRGYFPSSIGLSVLAPPDAEYLRITARWGDYEPLEKDAKPTGEWRRRERQETVPLRLKGEKVDRNPAPVPGSNGLEIVTSVRRVRGLEHLPGLPSGTRAISVFLVNRRETREGPDELKDSVRVSGESYR